MRKALILLVAAAALTALAACGGTEDGADTSAAAQSSESAMELPDGQKATPEQQAFLEQVTPNLTDDHASDVLTVLKEGESVCTVIRDPQSEEGQRIAIDLMTQNGRWNTTEATSIVRGAAEHFC